jgi:uncharacterized protein (TIGR00269 family)
MATPEKEIIAFVAFKKLEHFSEQCCPFCFKAKRNKFRHALNELEKDFPKTKFCVLKSGIEIGKTKKKISWTYCKKCGQPSSSEICAVCKKIDYLKN